MNLSEWWAEITASGVFTSAASYVAVKIKRIDKLEREKADRAELTRAMNMFEQRMDERDRETKQNFKEIHQKLDESIKTQTAFNLEAARYFGRTGRND